MKECTKCGERKPLVTGFSPDKRARDGRQSVCRVCNRFTQIQLMYGLSREEYETLVTEHAGLCAICNCECSTGKNLAVDHCHTTGKVRGLLCMSCNIMLGKAKDDTAILLEAVRYLGG